VRALQEFYARHQDAIVLRELHDALDERFHSKGGKSICMNSSRAGPWRWLPDCGTEGTGRHNRQGFGSVA